MKNVKFCGNCGKYGMPVYDSRERADRLRRRRKCEYCGARTATIELEAEEYDEMQKELQEMRSFIRELRKKILEKVGDLND